MSARMPTLLIVIVGFVTLAGCERAMHDMYEQPKQDPYASSTLFADGSAMRTPPPGSVAMASGAAADASSGRLGILGPVPLAAEPLALDEQGNPLTLGDGVGTGIVHDGLPSTNPLPLTMPLLQRGQQRFDIYCSPCHGRSGDGEGMIAQRGFPAPPSYHIDKLRSASDAHFYRVITHGYGLMYPYGDRVTPDDRWAIVAYIRALQLSRNAPVDRLQAVDTARLDAPAPAKAVTP